MSAELNFFKEIVYRGADSEAGVAFDGVGNNETCWDRIQLSLFSSAAVVRSRCVGAGGHASALSVFVPVEVVGTFSVLFLAVIHHHPIGLDPAIGADDDRTVSLAFESVDTLS